MSRSLRVLLAGDFVLRLVGMASYTLFIAAIYTTTRQTSDIGFVSAATVLPALAIMLLSGNYTARWSALGAVRFLMVARAAIFVVAALLPTGAAVILVTAALHSLCNQAAVSAKMSLDADWVDDESRRQYLSKKAMLTNVAIIAGPPLGGVAVEGLGFRLSLLLMAALSLAVAAVVSSVGMRGREHRAAAEAEHSVSPLASLRYLRALPYVAAVVGVYCLVAITLEVEAPLMFPLVKEVYHQGSGFTGVLLGLAGFGGITGAVLAQKLPKLFDESAIPSLIVADGSIFLAFTQISSTILACALFALLGVMGAVTLVVVEGTVQRHVAKRHRPLVFSTMQFAGGAGGASLGIATAFLAQAHGAKPVLAGCALAEIAAGWTCLVANRRVRVPNPGSCVRG